MTIIVVGLGNPGEKFKNTPHNIGFVIIDAFARKNSFPDFTLEKKLGAETSEENIFGKDIILAKPQTFMNNSGTAVKKILKKNKELIVIHDDIDLPFGVIKVSKNRGSAGHKGVESIIKALNTEDFIRLRIGVQPAAGKPKMPEKFVLKRFSKDNQKILEEIAEKSVSCLNLLIEHGLEKAMNACNK